MFYKLPAARALNLKAQPFFKNEFEYNLFSTNGPVLIFEKSLQFYEHGWWSYWWELMETNEANRKQPNKQHCNLR
jgi:hypothetical protein